MALEDILRKIIEDAEAEAAAALAAARAEQERILSAGQARAQAAGERVSAAGQAAAADARRKELATANVEVRRVVLSAKQEVLESVFQRAVTELASLPDAEYADLLAELATKAVATGTEQVMVSASDRQRLGPEWLAKVNAQLSARGIDGQLTYSDQVREIRGGLILQAGDIEINCSFERTLASLRDSLEPEVAVMLFGTDATEPPPAGPENTQ